MRVPLTATFFAAEVTGDMQALLPLLTASATAYAVTVLIMRRSILTEKITRRGHHIVCEYDIDAFVLTRVRDVMTTPVESEPATTNADAGTVATDTNCRWRSSRPQPRRSADSG